MRKKLSALLGLSLNQLGKNLLLPFFLLAFGGNVWGQTYNTYTAAPSTAWATTGNWGLSHVPSSSEVAQFNALPSSQSQINLANVTPNILGLEVSSSRTTALTIGANTSTSGTMTLGGTTINSVANTVLRSASSALVTFGAAGGTGTMTIALGNATENVVAIDGVGGITIAYPINGVSRKLIKAGSGSGVLILSNSNNTYSGGTIIKSGVLQLGASNALPVGSSAGGLILNGGTLRTGSGAGFSQGTSGSRIGTLSITENSTLALGTGAHNLYFADSNSATWTSGKTLTITGWSPASGGAGSAGTAGRIYVGSGTTGLTTAQLSQIAFSGYPAGAILLSTGELVPVSDSTPPTISILNPANGATNVLVGVDLVAAFSENVAKGTGNISIKRYTDDSVVETIDVTSTQVTVSGATVTINPTADLASNTHYYVEIANTAIKDIANNNFAGISGNATWNFTTETLTPSINLSSTTLSGFNYLEGSGPSAEQTFAISGQNLTGNITLTPPTHYEISKSTGAGFGSSISFTPGELASAKTVYVHLKAGLTSASSPYNSENIAISGGGIASQNVVCNGTVTANSTVTFANIQDPASTSIAEGSTVNVYAQAYKAGLTEAAGQAIGLTAWIGYSYSNSNPNGSGWTWVPATFNVQFGNNDEFVAPLGSGLTPGTYYYASRFQIDSGAYSYGGYNGGFWNGTTNVNGVLTVNSNVVTYANVQSPSTGTVVQGSGLDVYTRVYKAGYTEVGGANANISSWIGVSATNATSESDFASAAWTWVPATYNVQAGNDDEYVANIGASLAAGTYYYVSRYRVAGSTEYKYGGTNNNFWGAPANSGVLTVQTPREINVKQGSTNIASTGTYNFANQAFGTSSSAITFTVENTGQESLSVGALSISGANAGDFAITQVDSTLPHSVIGGGNTTFTVTFTPTGAGSKTAQLSLVNNDANENPYIINLTGIAGPANDNCSGATGLIVNAVTTQGTFLGATPTGSSSRNDVFYKFTPSVTGTHTITINGYSVSGDRDLYVYTSCPSSVATGGYFLSAEGTSTSSETLSGTFTQGVTYLIAVYDFSANGGTFNIRITANPALSTNGTTALAFGNVNKGTNSTSQSFNLSGYYLTGSPAKITVNAPTNYEVSLDNTNWASSVQVEDTNADAAIASQVYVRFNTTNACGASNGNVTFTGGGVTTPLTIALTATALVVAPTSTAGTDIKDTSFTAHWDAVPGATGYELDVYEKGTSVATSEAFNNPSSNSLNGWVFNNIGTSGSGANAYLLMSASNSSVTSIAVDLTNYVTKKLNFKARTYNGSNSTNNKITVSISTNDGGTWQVIGDRTPPGNSLTDMAEFDLASYAGNQVKIRFQTLSANGTIGAGISNLILSGSETVETKTYVSGYNAKPILGGSTISDVVIGLTPDTQYHYVVRATNGTCKSVNSTEINVKTSNNVVWDAGAWSNTTGPTATLNAIVRAPFVVGANTAQASFTAKDLTVESTGSLEIPSNQSITVAGNITTADNKITIDSDGSLLQTNAPATNQNTGKIIAKRSTHMRKLDYTYWGTPVTRQVLLNTSNSSGGTNPALYNAGGFSEGTPNNRIYEYNEPNDKFKAVTDAEFIPAKAYAIRGKDRYLIDFPSNVSVADQFTFRGIANNGAYTVEIQKSKNTFVGTVEYTHGYNMIGNPYPSSIDFIKFYNLDHGDGSKNSDHILGKAWFWTNVPGAPASQGGSSYTPNNYAILTLAGGASATGVNTNETTGTIGNPAPNQFIKVAQGFIVEMIGTPPTGAGATPKTATLKFDNSIRTNNNTGHFYNSKTSQSEIDRYWLKLISPYNIVNTILVAHMDGATNNYDANYDAELLSVGDDSFYSKLDTQKLQIQARSHLNEEDIVPLGTKYSTNGNYKISLGDKEGIFASEQKIYLKDKLTGSVTDLTSQDYIFTGSKGLDDSRFEIVYKSAEVLATDGTTKSDFAVYRDGTSFVIKSSFNLGKIELYDVSGKLISTASSSQKEFRLDATSIPSGVYIIRAENSGDIRTKKIIK